MPETAAKLEHNTILQGPLSLKIFYSNILIVRMKSLTAYKIKYQKNLLKQKLQYDKSLWQIRSLSVKLRTQLKSEHTHKMCHKISNSHFKGDSYK